MHSLVWDWLVFHHSKLINVRCVCVTWQSKFFHNDLIIQWPLLTEPITELFSTATMERRNTHFLKAYIINNNFIQNNGFSQVLWLKLMMKLKKVNPFGEINRERITVLNCVHSLNYTFTQLCALTQLECTFTHYVHSLNCVHSLSCVHSLNRVHSLNGVHSLKCVH